MKFLLGENSAMGSFDSPARKITCSYGSRSSTVKVKNILVQDPDLPRQMVAEPKQVHHVNFVSAIQQFGDQHVSNVSCTTRN